MKSKTVKYNEAIARNLPSLTQRVHEGKASKIKDLSLDQLRTRVGIRKTDHAFDDELKALLAKVQASSKKAVKEAKAAEAGTEQTKAEAKPGLLKKVVNAISKKKVAA